jgi:hypothetical protein
MTFAKGVCQKAYAKRRMPKEGAAALRRRRSQQEIT